MSRSTTTSRLSRAFALGLTAALVGAASLLGATAAQAVPGAYSVSGVVTGVVDGVTAPVGGAQVVESSNPEADNWTETAVDGTFILGELTDGNHTLSVNLSGYDGQEVAIVISGSDLALATPIALVPSGPPIDVSGVTVTISGSGLVGETLTASTSGWPVGTQFSYSWLVVAPGAQHSGNIPDSDSDTFTVTNSEVGSMIYVEVYGDLPTASMTMGPASNGIAASAPKRPTGAAPADTTGSTPAAQTSAGLPAGPLDPGVDHTANVNWAGADSYVDVYVFSTPTLVGTFPVVNGVAQITLSKAVLAKLSTGTHTLVITGQTSGAVQSVTLALGLAATGAENPAVPVTVASLLLLLGAGLLIGRRRLAQKA